MIKCLGRAYRGLYPDCEKEEELEEGLENNMNNRHVNSEELQDYMARQAQMVAPGSNKTRKGS